jgi:DNA primase small subunit
MRVVVVWADDFGFQRLLWVFSGRRGIHCWVSDQAAMELSDDQRRAIVNYIDIIRGGANQEKKVNLPRPLHPALA